jgi:hypothetical protein
MSPVSFYRDEYEITLNVHLTTEESFSIFQAANFLYAPSL